MLRADDNDRPLIGSLYRGIVLVARIYSLWDESGNLLGKVTYKYDCDTGALISSPDNLTEEFQQRIEQMNRDYAQHFQRAIDYVYNAYGIE
ncbi:MAG: hypothetical protein OXG55_03175 [bacterium]|nr:hypothetical protein [bacterium]MCY4102261.1 hypothetical protein [bacterium]